MCELSLAPLSCSFTRGLRRRVAQRPQRVLNSAVHFTACKAIISIPPPLSLFPPSGCWDCWVSSPSYGEWLPQPRRYWFAPVCKGEMFPNLSGQFLQHCTARNTAGHWIEWRKTVNITTITCWVPHTLAQIPAASRNIIKNLIGFKREETMNTKIITYMVAEAHPEKNTEMHTYDGYNCRQACCSELKC